LNKKFYSKKIPGRCQIAPNGPDNVKQSAEHSEWQRVHLPGQSERRPSPSLLPTTFATTNPATALAASNLRNEIIVEHPRDLVAVDEGHELVLARIEQYQWVELLEDDWGAEQWQLP
jgi:hypothetical protein